MSSTSTGQRDQKQLLSPVMPYSVSVTGVEVNKTSQPTILMLMQTRGSLWRKKVNHFPNSDSVAHCDSFQHHGQQTHPEIKERLWCAALAISQPLVRVFSRSARKVGQSTVISPMEMTSSRYKATSVLNSWTIWVKLRQKGSQKLIWASPWHIKQQHIRMNGDRKLQLQAATSHL